MLRKTCMVLLLTAIIVLAGCNAEPVEKDSLKIGSLPRVFDLIAYVGLQERIFEKHNIGVEILPFRSTVEMNTALLTGELDGMIQDLFEVVNLNKDEKTSKIVGWSVMPRMVEVVASQESNIGSATELKGKHVATANGTIMEYALDRLLIAEGLDSNEIVKVNIPIMPLRLEALNQGKVPAAILTPPLSDIAVLNGGKVIIDDMADPFAGPGLIFSLEALGKKSDVISRCIQAWQQSVETINANPGKYQGLLNEVARVPESLNFAVPTFPKLRMPSEAEVNLIVNWMTANRIMSKSLTLKEIVDTKYLR